MEKPATKKEGPNDHIGEPVDAPVGFSPRVVKVPMHDNADVNPKYHEAKEEEKARKEPDVKKGAGWNDKDERMYRHIKDSGASEQIAAATVNKQRKKEGRLLHKKGHAMKSDVVPHVSLIAKGGPGSGPRQGQRRGSSAPAPVPQRPDANALSQRAHAASQSANTPEEHQHAFELHNEALTEHRALGNKQSMRHHGDMMAHHAKVQGVDGVAQSKALDATNRADQSNTRADHEKAAAAHAVAANVHDAIGDHDTAAQHDKWTVHHQGKAHFLGKGPIAKSVIPQVSLLIKGDSANDGPGRIGGPGSRGGTIAYYTKTGKPVYQSSVSKKYPQMAQMASNWTDNAIRSASSDDHATAAKQHLAAAFYAHHAGNAVAAREHMHHADYHHATAVHGHKLGTVAVDESKMPKKPASKRTLGWIDKHKESTRAMIHGNTTAAVKKSLVDAIEDDSELQKAITPSTTGEQTMGKNEASDLFKAELGADAAKPVTHCVHCTRPLTTNDLKKGLGVHFVADDNDNPSSGGSGQVEPSRPGSGVSEHDVIAPLLKSCKGPEAGDGEEFPISKSEMSQMGMSVDKLDDGWYTITKSEMKRVGADEYIDYLADRKDRVAKGEPSGVDSVKPRRLQGTNAPAPTPKPPAPHGVDTVKPRRLQKGDTDGPHGYTPRAGGVQGPQGEPLVEWYQGDDAAIAKYCEQNGGYGPGTDESIRTEGSGRH